MSDETAPLSAVRVEPVVGREYSPEFSPDYEHAQSHRMRQIYSPHKDEIEHRCTNEGSDAAWASWPTMPRNPYHVGSMEHGAWGYGARAAFRAREDKDYMPPNAELESIIIEFGIDEDRTYQERAFAEGLLERARYWEKATWWKGD